MQQPAQPAKVILPNIQVYGNDCWLQSVVLLCYYNDDNYDKIINYKGNIPFLINLRNFFHEIENLRFRYESENGNIRTLEEFYWKVANLMLSTTEKLKDDTVKMNTFLPDSRDWYSKNSFYDPYNCIYAINTMFKTESNHDKDIIGDGIETLPAQRIINNSSDIEYAIALNNSKYQNVTFFHFPDHWTTAIRNRDGNFLYYDNMSPYMNNGKNNYFDGEVMQKYYTLDINKLMSICPNKENNQTTRRVINLENYYSNNQLLYK